MKNIKLATLLLFALAANAYGINANDFLDVLNPKSDTKEKEFFGPVKSIENLTTRMKDTINCQYREYGKDGNLLLEKTYEKGKLVQKSIFTQHGDTLEKETYFYSGSNSNNGRTIEVSTPKNGILKCVDYNKNDSIEGFILREFDANGNQTSRKSFSAGIQDNIYYKNAYDSNNRLVETKRYLENDSLISTTNYWYGDGFSSRKDSSAYKTTYSKTATNNGKSLIVELRTYSKYDEYTSFSKEVFYKWDSKNRLASLNGNINGQYVEGKCFYDKLDRLIKLEVSDSSSKKATICYKYDKKGRVIKETQKQVDPRYEYSKIKKYDNKDRLILEKKVENGTVSTQSYLYNDKTNTMVEKHGDKKQSWVSYIYTIDKHGNWTKKYNVTNLSYERKITYYK